MLRTTVAVGLCVVSMGVSALDVDSTVAVMCDGKPAFKQVSSFVGMSPADVADYRTRGQKVLDILNNGQGKKGGECRVEVQWHNEAPFVFQDVPWNVMTQAMREGVRWQGANIDVADKGRGKGPAKGK